MAPVVNHSVLRTFSFVCILFRAGYSATLPPSTNNNLDGERLTFDKPGPFKEPNRDDVASLRQANVAMFS